jgi:hypothetical protein|tara:strand:- start:11568 stop:12029 length:462 start_codon:yes stop_codon:yes gene_type:complete
MLKNEISSRSKIVELEKALLDNVDQENIIGNNGEVVRPEKFPLKHTFADGIYIRQMTMIKDSVVVGAIHNHLHVWFLLTGYITVATQDSTEDYIAPCYVVSTPGVKRVIYANEESIFVNVHKNPSNTQNLEELEAEIVSRNYKEYEQYTNKNK